MEKYIVKVNGKEYEVEVEKVGYGASSETGSEAVSAAPAKAPEVQKEVKGTVLEAGAAGKVWKILKKPGDSIESGETAVILEAMKMEIPMVATASGVINTIFVSEGQPVEAGDKLLTIE